MPGPFSFTSVTDRERRRIYLTAAGDMDSAGFVDGYIAEMDALGEPWTFDRVIDVRSCHGHAEYDDFVRLGKYWAPLTHRAGGPVKTAVVTQNTRTESRMAIVSMLLPGHEVRTFDDVEEADLWLDAPEA